MIAVDTNLLVYAHRPEMPFHECAREAPTAAVGGTEPAATRSRVPATIFTTRRGPIQAPKAPSLIRLKRS